jgi:hypothetical protein
MPNSTRPRDPGIPPILRAMWLERLQHIPLFFELWLLQAADARHPSR